MKNYKLKYSLVFLSYVILVFLIIVSYVSIIPEKEIAIFENTEPLIKQEKNGLLEEKNTVYEILEKKQESKTIENIIEEEIKKTNEEKNIKPLNRKFKIQLASFKNKQKSIEISKELEKKFFSDINMGFEIKKITLSNNDIYFRIIGTKLLSLNEAKNICKKIIKKKSQCLIVMGS